MFFSVDLLGQQEDYIINTKLFTPKVGLSHRDVTCIVQDEQNIIWIGTSNGLNRFDGKHFKVFSTEHGLKNNYIDELYSDKNVLWCLHSNVVNHDYIGFTLFDRITEQTVSLKKHIGKKLPFDESDIGKIDLEYKSLYIYLTNKKVYQYTSEKGLIPLNSVEKGETVLAQDENQNYLLWSKEQSYLKVLNKNGKIINKTTPEFLETALKIKYQGTSLKGDSWLSYNTSEEIHFFNIRENGNVAPFDDFLNIIYDLGVPRRKLYHSQLAYLPKFDAFLYSSKKNFLLIKPSREIILFDNSEKLKKVNAVELVQNGLFWLSSNNGFYQVELKKNPFVNYLNNANFKGFRGITKYDNHLYFNSYSGVFKLQPNATTAPKPILPKGLSSLIDDSNNLWISDYNALIKYNLETGDTTSFYIPNSHEIWSIYEDKKNRIWYSRNGLEYLNPKTGILKSVNYNGFSELINSTIYHFYEQVNGQVLLCTTSGLYALDIDKGIVARYFSGGKGKFKIPADDIRHLYFDKKADSYWLATGNKGLIHWNPNTGESEIYQLYHLEANTIHAVYPDNFGFLWLSTENGIIQFNKNSKRLNAYLPNHGTSSHEFNRISHFQDNEGTIYFGSIDGVTSFHPKDFVETSNVKEKVNIVVVELNQFLNKTGKIENLTAQFYDKNKITLKSDDRFFKLTLALDNYAQNETAVYYYKLKNEIEWSKTTNNEVSLSTLPYGLQMLQIKGLLINGQFSEIIEIPVRVQRPFYLTWWFGLLLLATFVGISVLFAKWKTRLLTIQKNVLEQEVQQRTAQIEAQAEKLKALDETKSRFFANVSHELRTPITLIQGPIQSALSSQKLDNRNFTLLTKAEQGTKNLLDLVNEILDLIKFDAAKLQLETTNIVLYTFLRRIVANFQSLADKKSIQFTFRYDLSKHLQVNLDKAKVEKILNNLLSNAFKFTPKNGKIAIQISETETNDILIKVEDTGRGILKADIPHIFNRFYQSSANRKAEGGLGIGLSLSMEFVKLMNGKMWVESQIKGEKTGSTFYLQLPKDEVIAMLPTDERLKIEEDTNTTNLTGFQNLSGLNSEEKQTILLVEDNLDLQEYISFLLSPNYNVITVENGFEAIERLTSDVRRQTSLIISDVMMPIMDGFELLEKLKANEIWRTIPVIMLTARAEAKDKLRALRIGVDDYLIKPFKEEELQVRIKNLLANYALRQSTVVLETTDVLVIENIDIENPTISEKDQIWLAKFEKTVLETLEDSRFSVNYLAELQNITRRTLSTRVKKLTGLTTNQYIRTVRLNLAKDLLENQSCQTVTEVAHRVGFQKVEYFSKLYKESFGKLPSEYL